MRVVSQSKLQESGEGVGATVSMYVLAAGEAGPAWGLLIVGEGRPTLAGASWVRKALSVTALRPSGSSRLIGSLTAYGYAAKAPGVPRRPGSGSGVRNWAVAGS